MRVLASNVIRLGSVPFIAFAYGAGRAETGNKTSSVSSKVTQLGDLNAIHSLFSG